MRRILTIIGVLMLAACSGGGDSPAATDVPTTAAEDTTTDLVAATDVADDPTPDPNAGQPALPLSVEGEQIVAEVNGEPITLNALQRAIDRNRADVTDIASYDTIVEAELTKLIEQAVIEQAAEEMGIVVTDADVEAEYQAIRDIVPDDAAWQRWLMDNRFISEAEFRRLSYDALLTQAVQEAVIDTEDMTVQQVRARHILVETEAEARAALQRLNEGEDFVALAAEISTDDTTANSGGELGIDGGWIVREDLTTPGLVDIALTLRPGQIAGPIETTLGYHLIETLEVGQRPATDAERARFASEQFNTWLDLQLRQADITRYLMQ